MSYSKTIDALEKITDYSNFERLCCDLLSIFKYEGIVPRGVGKIDGGIDAVLIGRFNEHEPEGSATSVRKKTVFHFSTRKDYHAKLYEDLNKTKNNNHNPSEVVFVSSRRIQPHEQDTIIEEVKSEYAWDLVIYDQEWLCIPLDTSYQNIRRTYLGIPNDLTIFDALSSLLENPNRHPNKDDFENGRFYYNAPCHDAIHKVLQERRMCLIKGKPGSGKTALARGTGYKYSKDSGQNIVLYLSADAKSRCWEWLSQIQQADYRYVLYIIDNCHNAIDEVNQLIERWHGISNAKILLISRDIKPELAGTSEENYLKILEDENLVVTNDITPDTIKEIVSLYNPTDRAIGDTEKILKKCEGDLHLLSFYIRVWLKESDSTVLSEIDEAKILSEVYSRYLNDRDRKYLMPICALSRFEIPVQSKWLDDGPAINSIEGDAFIESFVSDKYDHPVKFLKYFHSTPATYLLKAAYREGEPGGQSIDDYTLEQIREYLSFKPVNFFDAIQKLDDNGGEGILRKLFNEGSIFQTFEKIVEERDVKLLSADLYAICRVLREVFLWEELEREGKAYYLLQVLNKKIGDEGWRQHVKKLSHEHIVALNLIAGIDDEWCNKIVKSLILDDQIQYPKDIGLATVRLILQVLKQAAVDKNKLNAFYDGLDFSALGKRSKDSGLSTVRRFLQLAWQAGVDKVKLNSFCDGLNFKSLGARSKDLGLNGVRNFLEQANRAGVDKTHLNAFCEGLDFKALGERSRDTGLSTVMNFLRLTKLVGVDRSKLNTFCTGLEIKALGARSKDTGLGTVMTFLQLTKEVGVSNGLLKSFCESLDWVILGKSLGAKITDVKSPFFGLYSIISYSFISKEMATLFVEGIGWETMRKGISEQFSPDILAAAVKLLFNKCGLTPEELLEKGIVLNHEKIWLSSFINHPYPKTSSEQRLIQQNYLRYAGKCLVEYSAEEFNRKSSEMSLKSWNIFIRNISDACPGYLEKQLIPLFKDFSIKKIEELFCESDIKNIGLFLNRFNPKDGDFKWAMSDEVNFKKINFLEKIVDSDLKAISHFLFNFYFINRGDCSNHFAEQLDDAHSCIMPAITKASIEDMDFFFWNLWMAMPKGQKPQMFNDENIIKVIVEKVTRAKKNNQDEEHLLGLLGTIYLSTSEIPKGLSELLSAQKAKSLCEKSIKEGSIKQVRLLGGSLLLLPKSDLMELNKAVEHFQFSMSVPNQIEALRFIKLKLSP